MSKRKRSSRSGNKASQVKRGQVTWAGALSNIVVASINRGQLIPLIFGMILVIAVWRMPAEDLSLLMFRVLEKLANGQLLGYLLALAILIAWYINVKSMRRGFSQEYKRIGLEKSNLQGRLAGEKYTSSDKA